MIWGIVPDTDGGLRNVVLEFTDVFADEICPTLLHSPRPRRDRPGGPFTTGLLQARQR
jgi:hypothetical protein